MNYAKACEILKITPPINQTLLKKQYYSLAKLYHPDKSNNTSQPFQELHEAYIYLQTHDEYTEQVETVLDQLYNTSQSLFFSILHHLPEDTLAKIYIFLLKQEKLIPFNVGLSDHVYDILQTKKIVQIQPTLSQMLNLEIYTLKWKDHTLFIPLWLSELYYDEIPLKVVCNPILPPHISIDNNNNICVHVSTDKIENQTILIHLGSITFDLCLTNEIIKNKKYVYTSRGIPYITNDIYQVIDKGDIVIIFNWL